MQPAGVYVHVPFCDRVCPYCDFAVQTGGPVRRAAYLAALKAEIERLEQVPAGADTVYLGGGTPSALDESQLAAILGAVAARVPLNADVRVSLEANPDDVTRPALEAWRRLGVDTLSLGVQSFNEAALRFLGRAHSGAQADRAVRLARDGGFAVVSIDLIFGLPSQTAAEWDAELTRALELGPDHLSCYQLTVHERTRFGKALRLGQLREMAAPEQAELFARAHERLGAAGFEHYEVSNYAARPETRSRHNRKYWSHAPYLGLGPAAHSFDGQRRRWWNHRRLRDYEAAVAAGGDAIAGEEVLADEEIALETVMFGLRCRDGIDLTRLRQRTGLDLLAANSDRLAGWVADELVEISATHVTPTARGMAVAEYLAREVHTAGPAAGGR